MRIGCAPGFVCAAANEVVPSLPELKSHLVQLRVEPARSSSQSTALAVNRTRGRIVDKYTLKILTQPWLSISAPAEQRTCPPKPAPPSSTPKSLGIGTPYSFLGQASGSGEGSGGGVVRYSCTVQYSCTYYTAQSTQAMWTEILYFFAVMAVWACARPS